MKLLTFVSCVLAQITSAYIFVNYAINSASNLWQYCVILIICAFVVEVKVLE